MNVGEEKKIEVPETVEESLRRVAALVDGASQVALACHVHPDGDALGSMLALHHALRSMGRRSIASFPDPFVVAPHYRDLPGLDLMVPSHEFPAEPEVMITFACGALARLGELATNAKVATTLVVIDHHVSNQRYGAINVIDAQAAASGVLVRRLIRELGIPLNRDSATCLYAALACDTGRFQHSNTTPEVFALASELATYDVPIASLSRSLFEEHRFSYLGLLADVLARVVLIPEYRFVWVSVTQNDLERHGVTYEEVEGLIDVIRSAREAEVACVLKEAADGAYRVSMRSLGAVDVCSIAESEGGGGHRFAAGFTTDDPAPVVIERILAAL